MNKFDIQDKYREWWVGKKCRPLGDTGEFKRVKDVIFTGPFSGVYGVTELVFEDGTRTFAGSCHHFRARKKDVEVLEE